MKIGIFPNVYGCKFWKGTVRELLEWFGGLQAFADTHQKMVEHYNDSDISIEDE